MDQPPPPLPPPGGDGDDDNEEVSSDDIIASLIIGSAVFVVISIIFGYMRPRIKNVFQPRSFAKVVRRRPPIIPDEGVWSWILPTLRASEMEMFDTAGPDGLVFGWTFQFGVKLFVAFSFFAIPALVVNATADAEPENEDLVTSDLREFTTGNIKEGSDLFYVHLVTNFLFLFIFFYLCEEFKKKFQDLRYQQNLSKRLSYFNSEDEAAQAGASADDDESDGVRDEAFEDALEDSQSDMNVESSASTKYHNLGASESLDNDQGDYLAIASKEEPKKSKNDETDEEKPPLKPEDDDDHPESALEKGKASSSDKKMDAHSSPAAKDSNNQESFLAIFIELFLSMLGFSGQGNGGRLVREAPAEVSPDSFTVLLTDIPENSQDKIDEKMKELFPKSFVGAYAVHDSSQIASILAELDGVCGRLDDLEFKLHLDNKLGNGKRPTMKIKVEDGCCAAKKVVDAIDHLKEKKTELYAKLEEARGEVKSGETTSSSFVMFNTRRDASLVAKSSLFPDNYAWRAEAAPRPDNVYWAALKFGPRERLIRAWIAHFLFLFMIIGYLIVVTIVQGIAAGNKLPEPFKGFFESIYEVTVIGPIIQGLLPSLILIVALAIVPPIMLAIAKLEGSSRSKTELEKRVAGYLFYFYMFSIFLGSVAASTVLSSIEGFGDIEETASSVASSLSESSGFFINFVLVKSLMGPPVELLQIPTLIAWFGIFPWRPHVRKGPEYRSDLQKILIWPLMSAKYSKRMADSLLIVLIGLAYSTISPLVLLVTLFYFVTNSLVMRYHILYVYVELYQGSGGLWPTYVEFALQSLVAGQLLLGFLFLSSQAYVQCGLMATLIYFTLKYKTLTNNFFESYSSTIPISTTMKLAEDGKEEYYTSNDSFQPKNSYAPPGLQDDGQQQVRKFHRPFGQVTGLGPWYP